MIGKINGLRWIGKNLNGSMWQLIGIYNPDE